MILLLCAASLFIGRAHPERLLAAETAVISSTPISQVESTNSLRPSASGQLVPYQMEQNTSAPEPPGLKEYMDANEQISVLGIDLRVETRKAEKEIQGLLVVDIAPGTPGAAAGTSPLPPTRARPSERRRHAGHDGISTGGGGSADR